MNTANMSIEFGYIGSGFQFYLKEDGEMFHLFMEDNSAFDGQIQGNGLARRMYY